MAKRRKKIKPEVKRRLVAEAGNKCANPGCRNWRSHFHHIKHWAVYQSDDEKDMIAVCPSCHDAIHHGALRISDETLYEWKKSHKATDLRTAHIFVEPHSELKLLTGTLAIATGNEEAIVFRLSDHNLLRFRALDNDIMLVSSKVTDLTGREVLRVHDNYVRSNTDPDVVFEHVPGHVRITVPVAERFTPDWLVNKMRVQEPAYASDGRIPVLDLEVISPGLVRVLGLWADTDTAVVITETRLSFVTRALQQPLSLIGEGEQSVLKYVGSVDKALFGLK